ncbi:MAG: hypothetical protein J0M12_15745 [Deltaproteobacteria bacterium]|nr:hypothetical protein [Deltaproteobacteria bacterium]
MTRSILFSLLSLICAVCDASASSADSKHSACMERAQLFMEACFYETPLEVLPRRTTKFLHCIQTMVRCSREACETYAGCISDGMPDPEHSYEIAFEACDQKFYGENGPALIEPYAKHCGTFTKVARPSAK